MSEYHLIEKKHPLHLHGIFDDLASAERHLKEMIPMYVAKSYFMDKTLRPEDFIIVPAKGE